MAEDKQQATKAEVQTTELNKLPVPGQDEAGLSAEEEAEVFQQAEFDPNRTEP
jgi:hypothetical protein